MNRAEYAEYLRSDHWRAVKQRYRNSKMPKRCSICKDPRMAGAAERHSEASACTTSVSSSGGRKSAELGLHRLAQGSKPSPKPIDL
jgi:predicted adenine nucleotide alpha hydrolase (AANH) superfamily ATPase